MPLTVDRPGEPVVIKGVTYLGKGKFSLADGAVLHNVKYVKDDGESQMSDQQIEIHVSRIAHMIKVLKKAGIQVEIRPEGVRWRRD